jgi:UDP-N-acetyl-D-mannosaminuronate dehydrogenase
MLPEVTAAAMNAIAARPLQMVTRVRDELADSGIPVLGARILVVGVTYKPNVEDVRASPALEIMTELVELGSQVGYIDPHVPELRIGDQVLVNTHAPIVGDWDLLLIHTLHRDVATDWIDEHPRVLDATYQLSPRNRYTVP